MGATVWRLQQQLDQEGNPRKLSKQRSRDLSIVHGRSMCETCRHELAWYDLLPIVSWVMARGTCRYCNAQIGIATLAIEVLMPVLFVVSYVAWPVQLVQSWQIIQFVTWLLCLVGLVGLAWYDARTMILPDRILAPLIVFAAVSLVAQILAGRSAHALVEAAGAIAVCSGIFAAVYAYGVRTHKELIGFGDVKLGILIGLLVSGAFQGFLVLFLASVLGCVWVLVAAAGSRTSITSSMTMHVPFGPFLIAATFVTVLWGADVLALYIDRLT